MKELKTEVAVIAAGPSGLASAIQAAEDGAQVMVFEKANLVGGAANMGMGPLGIGTKQQKKMMIDLTVEKAFKMFMEYTHWRVDANLVKRYFENSADTIEWLENMGVEFAGAYKYFERSQPTWHIVAVNGGIGRNGGAIMNKVLARRAEELGVQIHLETPAQKIHKDEEGKVCGITVTNNKGEEIYVHCKAVILATGGAGDNPAMIRERMGFEYGKNLFNYAVPGLKGDGIRMAQEVGAETTDMIIEMGTVLPNSAWGAAVIPAVFNQPNLMVNQLGRRYFNEDEMQNTTFAGNAINIQKDKCAYNILDAAILKGYVRNGLDVISFVHNPEDISEFDEAVEQQIEQGNIDLFKADTLEELAEKLGIDEETFLDTVEEYNEMCQSSDSLFYKDSRYMKPIRKAPFYAGKFRVGGYGTLGGIKINDRAEVLDKEWNPIPGLYAAGTDTCAIFGDSYMFYLPGNTMGYCLNTGRFAGESAALYCEDQDE